jgi:hypothetical protein
VGGGGCTSSFGTLGSIPVCRHTRFADRVRSRCTSAAHARQIRGTCAANTRHIRGTCTARTRHVRGTYAAHARQMRGKCTAHARFVDTSYPVLRSLCVQMCIIAGCARYLRPTLNNARSPILMDVHHLWSWRTGVILVLERRGLVPIQAMCVIPDLEGCAPPSILNHVRKRARILSSESPTRAMCLLPDLEERVRHLTHPEECARGDRASHRCGHQ